MASRYSLESIAIRKKRRNQLVEEIITGRFKRQILHNKGLRMREEMQAMYFNGLKNELKKNYSAWIMTIPISRYRGMV